MVCAYVLCDSRKPSGHDALVERTRRRIEDTEGAENQSMRDEWKEMVGQFVCHIIQRVLVE